MCFQSLLSHINIVCEGGRLGSPQNWQIRRINITCDWRSPWWREVTRSTTATHLPEALKSLEGFLCTTRRQSVDDGLSSSLPPPFVYGVKCECVYFLWNWKKSQVFVSATLAKTSTDSLHMYLCTLKDNVAGYWPVIPVVVRSRFQIASQRLVIRKF